MSPGHDDPNVAFADVVAASGRVRDALVTVGGDVEVLRRCARELEAIAGALTGCALSPGEPDPMAAPTIDPRYGIRRRGLIPRHTVTSEDGRQLTGVATSRDISTGRAPCTVARWHCSSTT